MPLKKILITGANSYIGIFFESYLQNNFPNEYQIDTIDMIDPKWMDCKFYGYDTIFHVAGIAHADIGHVSEEQKKMYYKVNCDLAVETAKKAQKEGVKQFIYMSSIIVYGESAPLGKSKIITKHTKPNPSNFYGDSKLQADFQLNKLSKDDFKVCIVRPPMIYGPGSKGNYQLLSKLAKKLPIFPNIKNQRSMLYVGNLCFYIKDIIDKNKEGTFFPQNAEYISTSELVKQIAYEHHKKIYITRLLNPVVYICSKIPGKVSGMCNKAFGNMVYDMEDNLVEQYDFVQSIHETEVK